MARRIGLALLWALALIVLLIAGAFGLAQTGFGKRLIASQLGGLLSTPEMTVEISDLQGTVPIDMRVGRVTAADPDGVWLEVDDARLAWSPGALLGGRIWIDELGAARVRVDRLPPSEPDTQPPEPIRMPELPDWLPPTTLQQLSVAEIDLGEPVLGEAASFSLTGHLGTAEDGRSATARLDLERTDEATASVTLDASLAFGPPALDLAVSAAESGGLLAALTGRPDASGFTLELTGHGPLDAWTGQLRADAEGLAQAQADLDLSLGDQLALSLDGGVEPAPGLLPADFAAILGDRLGLTVSVVQTGAQQLRIDQLRATASGIEVAVEGRVDLEAEQFRADARLALADLAAFSELAGVPTAGDLRVDLTAEGGFLQPSGTVQLHGSGLEAAGIGAESLETSIDFAAREPLSAAPRGLQLTGRGQASGLTVPEVDPLPARELSWQLDLEGRAEDAIDINLLRLSAAGTELTIRGEADPQSLAAAGQIDLTVRSLAQLTAPFVQPSDDAEALDGDVALRADFLVAEQAQQIEARLRGEVEQLAGLPPGAAELLGSTVEIATRLMVRPDSLVRIEDLTVDAAAVALAGELALTLPEQNLDGALAVRLPRLAVLEPLLEQPASGALDLDATIGGSVDAPELELAVRGRELVIADRQIGKLALLATASGPTDAPGGRLELGVTTAGIDADLSTQYQLRDQSLALSDLSLQAPRSRVTGALTLDLERMLIDGSLRGRVEDLAGLGPVLPMPLRGAVDLDVSLRPEDARQTVQISLAVRELLAEFGRLQRLEANATVRDALGTPAIEAQATVQDFRQDAVHLERLGLDTSGTMEQLTLNATATGEATEPFDLETRAVVAQGDALRIRLEQLSGEVAGQPVRLAGPAEATVGDRELRLAGLDLQLAGARLSADAALAGGQVTVDAALRDLAMARLAQFGAPDLIGEANATLQMRGAANDPHATLDLTIQNLRVADPTFDDLPPARLTANASLASRRLSLDARGEGVTDQPLLLTAELPVVLQLDPFAFEMPDGAVAGRLDGRAQLARLADVAGLDDDRLEGLLAVALAVSGTTMDPQLNGTIDVTNGIYENGTTGTVLHDLTLHARARQQRLTIETLSATDGGSGRLSGQGFVEIDPAEGFPMEVSLSLRNARLVQTNEATAVISGDLAVDGDASAASLGGKLTVDRADIQLPESVGPSVPTIEVEEVGFGTDSAQSNGDAGGSPFQLGLDVVVELPGRVFVRGRGLESEWQGRIEATGTASDPRLSGSISIKRGYFDLLDQRFELRQGVITFNGQSPPSPVVDIEAVAQAVDVTAIIQVEGPATSPTLTLTSQPELPQDEVLSRLLFNRAASEITPAQAVQLAAAVNRLRGGGPGVLDRLRNALGVDTLDVGGGAGADGGTSVRAGKYLSDDVYVEAETGTADQSSRARVEVEILPNLSLEADTGADATSGVGIKWKYDY